MKNRILILLILTLCGLSDLSAQNEKSNWRFGVGIGFNSLKLGKERGFTFLDSKEREVKHKGKRYSFHGNVTASKNINNHWRFNMGLGLTNAKRDAYRKMDDSGFLSSSHEIYNDDVLQKYLLLDLPIYFRWQIIAENSEKYEGLKPFIDFGLSLKFPLINKSSYRREHTSVDDPWFGPRVTTSRSYSGALELQPVSLYFAIGVTLGENGTIAWSLSGVRSKAENGGGVNFRSSLKSLTITHFF